MEERKPNQAEDEDLTPAFLSQKRNPPRATRRVPTGNRAAGNESSPTQKTRSESDLTPLPLPAEASPKNGRDGRLQPRRRPAGTGGMPAVGKSGSTASVPRPSEKKETGTRPAPPTAVRRPGSKSAPMPPAPVEREPQKGSPSRPVAVRRQGESRAVAPAPPPVPVPREEPPIREMPPPVYSTDEDEDDVPRRSRRPKDSPLRRLVRLACWLFLGIVAVLLVRTAMSLWMPVRSLSVEGVMPEWGYGEAEILGATKLSADMRLKDVSEAEISQRISDAFPYLCGATVSKTLLGKVTVTVRYETPAYLFTYEEKTYVLSESLKVLALARGDEPIPYLVLSRIESCEIGRDLAFLGEYDFDFVRENAERLTALFANYRIDRIGIESKYDLYLVCESKYKLLFGNQENLDKKSALAQKTLLDPTFAREGQAVIDVSSGTKASVKFTDIGN